MRLARPACLGWLPAGPGGLGRALILAGPGPLVLSGPGRLSRPLLRARPLGLSGPGPRVLTGARTLVVTGPRRSRSRLVLTGRVRLGRPSGLALALATGPGTGHSLRVRTGSRPRVLTRSWPRVFPGSWPRVLTGSWPQVLTRSWPRVLPGSWPRVLAVHAPLIPVGWLVLVRALIPVNPRVLPGHPVLADGLGRPGARELAAAALTRLVERAGPTLTDPVEGAGPGPAYPIEGASPAAADPLERAGRIVADPLERAGRIVADPLDRDNAVLVRPIERAGPAQSDALYGASAALTDPVERPGATLVHLVEPAGPATLARRQRRRERPLRARGGREPATWQLPGVHGPGIQCPGVQRHWPALQRELGWDGQPRGGQPGCRGREAGRWPVRHRLADDLVTRPVLGHEAHQQGHCHRGYAGAVAPVDEARVTEERRCHAACQQPVDDPKIQAT